MKQQASSPYYVSMSFTVPVSRNGEVRAVQCVDIRRMMPLPCTAARMGIVLTMSVASADLHKTSGSASSAVI